MSDEFYFSFDHQSSDGNWRFSRSYEYDTPWDTVLQDFLDYLSGVYGYDISKKVSFEGLQAKVERFNRSDNPWEEGLK